MKIKKLDSRGFSHEIVAILFVVVVGVVGTAYLVASHAATPNTGPVTTRLTAGTANLCLNASGVTNADFAPINVLPCQSGSKTQSWQVKPTEQTTVNSQAVQAYSISFSGGQYCVGVNGLKFVELFGCRANQKSFNSSFQQWAVLGGKLVNVNPKAVSDGTAMCMTATASASKVLLSACAVGTSSEAAIGQMWTLPLGTGGSTGTTSPKPSTPTDVNATAKGTTSVTVTWQASTDTGGPGLGGYYVLRNGAQLSSVPVGTLTYTDTTASADTQYSYTVEAYDKAAPPNVSAPSVAAVVTTPSAGSGSSGSSSKISCNYGPDTWSGDATKVGYSVTKVSATNGNPASYSVEISANKGTTEVVGYPSVQCLLYAALPSTLTSSFNITPPAASAGLDYEYAYDIWLTTASDAQAYQWSGDLELMIWTDVNGQVPAGSVAGTLADGSKVWVRGSNSSGTVSVVLPKNETSGTVNIASIVSQLKSGGYITTADNGILDVEYGIEAPYGGGQTFTVNSLSVVE